MVNKKQSRNDVNRSNAEDYREPRREDHQQKRKEKRISSLLKTKSLDISTLTDELED